ncbi:hypothetical protein IKP13_04645 [bacterium]|nr:hypothetical protein [bacterium]
MRSFFSFFFIVFLPFILFCKDLTIAEYIEAAKDDPRLKSKKAMSDSIDDSNDTPGIKGLEFRSETGNFDIMEQKYALRLYFKGFGETRSSREFVKNMQALHKLDYISARSEVLFERYRAVVTYIQHKKELKIIETMRELLNDKLSVTEKIGDITGETTEIDKMDIEDKITEIEMRRIEVESTVETIEAIVKNDMGEEMTPAFDKEKIVSVGDIEKFAQSLDDIHGATKAESSYQTLREIVAGNEIALEQAKERDWLKYIALEYNTDDRTKRPSRGFSIGFAITIPGFKNNQTSIIKKQIKSLEQNSDFESQSRIKETEIRIALLTLKREIRQYKTLAERKDDIEKSGILQKYSSIEGVNPMMVIKLKEKILKKELKLAELEFKIYEKYINLAYLMGLYEDWQSGNFLSGESR